MHHATTWAPSRDSRGITLIELLLTVTIAAALLVVTVPAFSEFSQRQRMEAAVSALHAHLMLARNEAIHRNVTVVACPGSGVSGCRASIDWSDGWIVFSDHNADRERQPGEELHRSEPGLEQLVIRSSNGRQSLRFTPTGSAPASNASISFCDLRGPSAARKLVVSNTGRIRRDTAPATDPADCP